MSAAEPPSFEPLRVPVAGTRASFPVRRIWCVGRNYAAHAREMGSDPEREPPCFFSKPATAIALDGAAVPYPPQTACLHHEVELVVALARGGRDIPPEAALDHVFGYAVGIDLTRRDLQHAAKAAGQPWTLAKSFDRCAPVGAIAATTAVGHLARGRIALEVNGACRQGSDLGHMVWSVAEIIAALSRSLTLLPGDLLFTGTPEGVGPLAPGDQVRACIDGLPELTIAVTDVG